MSLLTTERLHKAVAAVCPIIGVDIGTIGVSASVRIDFDPSATPGQQAAAQAVVNGFDWSQSAQVAFEDSQQPERTDLRQQAAQAVADNQAYLAIASPTAAQVRVQVEALTRQANRIIRRLAQID